jgi:hypothetical protein
MQFAQRSLARSGAAKPFTGVKPTRVARRRVRAAEEEAAEEEGEAVATISVDLDEETSTAAPADDYAFSYSEAKRGNQWEASDVAAAIAFFEKGEGAQPDANVEFVTNPLGIEVRGDALDGVERRQGGLHFPRRRPSMLTATSGCDAPLHGLAPGPCSALHCAPPLLHTPHSMLPGGGH